jgi:hypothetical protein
MCCDYSMENAESREAEQDDRLITRKFGSGTVGFASENNPGVAVCIAEGTEISFQSGVRFFQNAGLPDSVIDDLPFADAVFVKKFPSKPNQHHDALEFPDRTILLNHLCEGQRAVVAALPASSENVTVLSTAKLQAA